jgi:acetylornithine deacetylase
MDLQELRGELHCRVLETLEDSGITTRFTPLFDGIPAMDTPASTRIVQLAERLTGHQPGAVAFGTEAPYLRQLGMDTVILGPGDIDQAHQPDEFIALDQLQPTVKLLRELVNSICINSKRLL